MNFNGKYMKNAFILVTFAIMLMWALDNLNSLWGLIRGLFSLLTPFIIGVAIAFIMNIPLKFLEKKIFKKMPIKYKRPIAYIITLFLFLLIIFIVIVIVAPEFYNSIQELINRIPAARAKFLDWFETTELTKNKYIANFIDSINLSWEEMDKQFINLLTNRASGWLKSTFAIASSLVGTIVSIVVGFVFSVYILLQKEKLIDQVRKVSLSIFPTRVHERLVYLANLTSKSFSNFISVQLLEAILIGLMFFIAMKIFKFPYALVISILIGITSFIPIVGAFIGAIVGTLLIAVENVRLAFLFIIMFLIIQQIEGNLIYPQIAGKTVGLPSIWVFVAVTLGGSLFGVMGIILFVPLGTILYTLFKEFVNNRLEKKNLTDHDIK